MSAVPEGRASEAPEVPEVPDAAACAAVQEETTASHEGPRARQAVRPDARPTDARPTDARPTDARPTDARPTDARPTDASASALLRDVPVELVVELARVTLPLGELSQFLVPGGVIPLEQIPGARLDVRVQSRLVARGEAIAIGDRCGVRILELVKGGK